MTDASSLLSRSYQDWLVQCVRAEEVDYSGMTELTTPFVDRHNDFLQVYAESRAPDLYLITDDGYIMADLKSAGVESRGTRRVETIARILAGHGVTLKNDELQVEATSANLGQRTHDLVQAMLSLDDMFVLAQENVKRVFHDDVQKFLSGRDVRFTSNVKFPGKSGLAHLFDFVIPESKEAPERAIQVVNSPRRDRLDRLLFTVGDIRRVRGDQTNYYAIVDDSRRPVPVAFRKALNEYSVKTAPWSEIDNFATELAA